MKKFFWGISVAILMALSFLGCASLIPLDTNASSDNHIARTKSVCQEDELQLNFHKVGVNDYVSCLHIDVIKGSMLEDFFHNVNDFCGARNGFLIIDIDDSEMLSSCLNNKLYKADPYGNGDWQRS